MTASGKVRGVRVYCGTLLQCDWSIDRVGCRRRVVTNWSHLVSHTGQKVLSSLCQYARELVMGAYSAMAMDEKVSTACMWDSPGPPVYLTPFCRFGMCLRRKRRSLGRKTRRTTKRISRYGPSTQWQAVACGTQPFTCPCRSVSRRGFWPCNGRRRAKKSTKKSRKTQYHSMTWHGRCADAH